MADVRYTGDGSALHRSIDPADGKVYLYTNLGQPGRVYACFDQADLKAEFTVRVTAPASWTVLSDQLWSGGFHRPGWLPVPSGTSWRCCGSPPARSLLSPVITRSSAIRTRCRTARVIPLGLACRASLAGQLDRDDLLDVTRTGLDYYPALFGLDFPFAKYDQVFVPQLPGGAMEYPGGGGDLGVVPVPLARSPTSCVRTAPRGCCTSWPTSGSAIW